MRSDVAASRIRCRPNVRVVNVLTAGFTTPNGRAFLFPLVRHRRLLLDIGIDVRFHRELGPHTADCDVAIIDSKYHREMWASESERVLAEVDGLRESVGAVLFFDTGDSSGMLLSQLLPHVTAYYKSQLLTDRTRYLAPMYGHRLYTDYYHREFGVDDGALASLSTPVEDPTLLSKLGVSWNSGLADYSWLGPARMAAYRYLPLGALLRSPGTLGAPDRSRPIDVSCRMSIQYPRATVAYQRRELMARLARTVGVGTKLGRRRYLREMTRSKVVVSPFGWGEITLKDFEAVLCGAVLLKPDMSHMETYPDLFRDGETIATHSWDLADLEESVARLLASPEERLRLATAAQERYAFHLIDEVGHADLAARFHRIVESALTGTVIGGAD